MSAVVSLPSEAGVRRPEALLTQRLESRATARRGTAGAAKGGGVQMSCCFSSEVGKGRSARKALPNDPEPPFVPMC